MKTLPSHIALARLASKTSELEPHAATTGESWSQSDLAACLAGLGPQYERAARVRGCLDSSVLYQSGLDLYLVAVDLAARERWKVPKGEERIRALAQLAVLETYDPRVFSDFRTQMMAAGLEHEPMEWLRTWRPRYEALYQIYQSWADAAGAYMRRRQGSEDGGELSD